MNSVKERCDWLTETLPDQLRRKCEEKFLDKMTLRQFGDKSLELSKKYRSIDRLWHVSMLPGTILLLACFIISYIKSSLAQVPAILWAILVVYSLTMVIVSRFVDRRQNAITWKLAGMREKLDKIEKGLQALNPSAKSIQRSWLEKQDVRARLIYAAESLVEREEDFKKARFDVRCETVVVEKALDALRLAREFFESLWNTAMEFTIFGREEFDKTTCFALAQKAVQARSVWD